MTHAQGSVVDEPTAHAGRAATTWLVRGGIVAVASLLLGGATSYGQGALPDAIASVANSASGWTLLTALLVAWARVGVRLSAALGAVSFVLLVIGYTIASSIRGYAYDPVLFSVVGLVAGPVVGVATAWLRERDVRAALGTAVLAGIGAGEATYGLTYVSETTHAAYWILIGVVALTLLAGMLVRRIRGPRNAAAAVAGTAAVAAAFVVAYVALGR